MQEIVGRNNGGYLILDVAKTSENTGYALGRSKYNFATWRFAVRENNIDFHYVHYFPIDKTNVTKSRTRAYENLYARAAEEIRYQMQDTCEFYYDHPEGVQIDE